MILTTSNININGIPHTMKQFLFSAEVINTLSGDGLDIYFEQIGKTKYIQDDTIINKGLDLKNIMGTLRMFGFSTWKDRPAYE